MEEIGRNDPCSCGSGKKYKRCCAQRADGQPASIHPTRGGVAKAMQAAIAHHQAGRLPDANAVCQQILQVAPNHPDPWHLMGVMAYQIGMHDVAIELIGRALELAPNFADAHNNLGNALKEQGKLAEAVKCYQKAILLKPDHAQSHYNLGNARKEQGKLAEAVESYQKAILLKPDYARAHNNLGDALQEQGMLAEAGASYHRALGIDPDLAEVHYNLGCLLKGQGKLEEAAESYRKAIALKPDYADAHNNLGTLLKDQGRSEEAVTHYRQALSIKPDYAPAHNNLGGAFLAQGWLDEAIACLRQALLIKPDDAAVYSNLIFALDMTVGADTQSLQAERKRWSEVCAVAPCDFPLFSNRLDPGRRLRIGYVSADFRKHSAAAVFGLMLAKFDSSAFEVFAYSNSVKEDTNTHLFQQSVTCWKNIVDLPDDAVAELIRQDGIDILVDLSGHSAGNRLLVFARKPAPIQVTAWGYIGGTGMKAMDVFLADPVVVPLEEKQYYAEEVRYLPNVVGAFFPETFPPIEPLPAASAKGITFGSFNRLAKVSEGAFKAWAQILLAIPASRMVFKTAQLDDAVARDRVVRHFIEAGVNSNRIVLLGKTSWQDHMAAFNQIDIALDPFPHGGGVTTLEGLMMGVPVVALRWPTLGGRLSASILTTLGLTDWIAETQEQYVELAIRKAQDLTALAALRRRMRDIFTTSVVGDPQAYVRAVEREYRQLWREYVQSKGR
ncbi:MAG: tetratricopeptide repeat protein [Sulfuricella sp.]|nr:tetratricopeptide repeat protein [Sulfuricella sp.]